jgi:hypothetical protein
MPNLPAKTSWCSIICFSNGEYTLGKYHFQKHLSQHMIGDTGTDWILPLRNAFLIRDPAEMIASYNVKRETVATEDPGLAQQVKLYRFVSESAGSEPPVIDARDFLQCLHERTVGG